jgi:hypothetical protein
VEANAKTVWHGTCSFDLLRIRLASVAADRDFLGRNKGNQQRSKNDSEFGEHFDFQMTLLFKSVSLYILMRMASKSIGQTSWIAQQGVNPFFGKQKQNAEGGFWSVFVSKLCDSNRLNNQNYYAWKTYDLCTV